MLNIGELCAECLCAVCKLRESCGTMCGDTEMYCKSMCKGEESTMNDCSRFIREEANKILIQEQNGRSNPPNTQTGGKG